MKTSAEYKLKTILSVNPEINEPKFYILNSKQYCFLCVLRMLIMQVITPGLNLQGGQKMNGYQILLNFLFSESFGWSH